MKIIYYLKNLKPTKDIVRFIQSKAKNLKKILPKKEEALIEVEISKDKETKEKKGIYKVKVIVDLPKRPIIIIKSFGKTLLQAINNSFKRLKRELTRKS